MILIFFFFYSDLIFLVAENHCEATSIFSIDAPALPRFGQLRAFANSANRLNIIKCSRFWCVNENRRPRLEIVKISNDISRSTAVGRSFRLLKLAGAFNASLAHLNCNSGSVKLSEYFSAWFLFFLRFFQPTEQF